MREGWKCPACKRINSPDLSGCPCSEGGASVTADPLRPVGGSGGTFERAAPTTIYTWPSGGGSVTSGTTWQGVTLTATNAA
jgi:hypothetical protein